MRISDWSSDVCSSDLHADRLAAALSERGIKAGDVVGVRTQIRLEWPVIDAALAKLGAAVLGMNWRLPPAEVEYVLGNSGAAGLICDDADPPPQLPAPARSRPQVQIRIDPAEIGRTLCRDSGCNEM